MRPSAPASPVWRAVARFVLTAAGLASLAFTLYAGRHNASVALVSLFVLWVSSPFVGFGVAVRSARQAPGNIANTIYATAIVIALCSTTIYAAVAFSGPGHHTAFAFLVVPAASWLAIAPLLIAAKVLRIRT